MPKLDLTRVPVKTVSIYPEPYASMMKGRSSLRLGEAGGLTQFGVNLVTLDPGGMSSLRHWHQHEDEFVWIVEGECILVQDEGETVMRPGDCAAFPAGSTNGHHFLNRTDRPTRFMVVGTKAPREVAVYSDVDLMVELTPGERGRAAFTYKDGTEWKGPR
ncbi:MAG: cupin domain-containing protein [Gemmobacter sp.]